MNVVLKKLLLVTFVVCICSCSAFVPTQQNFTARCSEADADLYINESHFKGVGTAKVKRNKSVSVMCVKDGFIPRESIVNTTISNTGVADAIGGAAIWLPAAGLFFPGAWKLSVEYLNLTMEAQAK